MKDRNTPIDALRFLFMFVLCMIHYDYDFSVTSLYHGYFVVEFFFMVSGFYIYTTYQKHPETGCFDYTINKVKKFVVPVSICLLLQMLLDRKSYFYIPDTINILRLQIDDWDTYYFGEGEIEDLDLNCLKQGKKGTIVAPANSYIEQYCKENGYRFRVMTPEEEEEWRELTEAAATEITYQQ